nr:tRNA threonylcarbamoyladenosine dehydratase [Massilistercora timonensis]
MEEVFSRTEQLLGREKFQKLRRCHVMVLGAGGVGSHCVEALARAGVGRLTLVDSDRVAPSNINRQSIALLSTVGRYKTEVMREKIRDICPDTQVECRETFVLPDNVDTLFEERPDYIVDAIDTVSAKIAVAEKAREYKIPLISSMGTGNKLHGELFQIGDLSETSVCPLCRVMRRELKKRGIEHLKVLYSTEKPISPQASEKGEDEGKRLPPGSISFVPPVAGLLIAGEVVRDLLEL